MELDYLFHTQFAEAGRRIKFNNRGETILRYHFPDSGFKPLTEFLQVLRRYLYPCGVLVTSEFKEKIAASG